MTFSSPVSFSVSQMTTRANSSASVRSRAMSSLLSALGDLGVTLL